MSDDGYDLSIPADLQPYSADQALYRAIIYRKWLKDSNTRVHHEMFYRRSKDHTGFSRDSKGLSVDTTTDACRANFAESIHGLINTTVCQIRDIKAQEGNLDVVPETNTHGNIKKVPYRDEDPIEATRIAKLLAKMSLVYEHD